MPNPVLLILLLLIPAASLAEGFVDLYGGWAITQDDDNADVETSRPLFTDDAEFEDSPVAGVRLGAWLEAQRHLGGALDLSWFSPDGEGGLDGADLRVFPVAALLMARLPLMADDDHPNGRLQPYLAAGPALFVTEFQARVDPSLGKARDTSVDLGADGRLGATFFFLRDLGVFLEYRFTYYKATLDTREAGVKVDIRPVLATHRAQLGFTLRY